MKERSKENISEKKRKEEGRKERKEVEHKVDQ